MIVEAKISFLFHRDSHLLKLPHFVSDDIAFGRRFQQSCVNPGHRKKTKFADEDPFSFPFHWRLAMKACRVKLEVRMVWWKIPIGL
jgi:hypothetical protein